MSPDGGFVTVDSVSKYYGRFLALDRVSFQIRKGDVFGYIGPNGSGKTTTIKIIVGLLRDFGGNVMLGDRSLREDWGILHSKLGYLPQQTGFQDWRTVDHALRTLGKLSGMRGTEIDSRIKEVLEWIGISETRHKKISKLSGGTVQKVGMAQAILHRPEFLVLDEPMTGLDPKSRFDFKNIFKELSRNGTTIFFSSHILSDVQDLANRIGILNGGKITHLGSTAELEERMKLPKQIDVSLSHDSGKWRSAVSVDEVKEIVETSPGNLTILLREGKDVDRTVDELIRRFLAADCRIRRISPVTPSLEELYMRYLGGGERR